MAEEKYVLFKRYSQDQDSLEDVWDDTALIEAYDKAVNLAKEKAAAKLSATESSATASVDGIQSFDEKLKTNTSSPAQNHWKIGDYVTAVYSEDGVIYEAVIESLNNRTLSCIVKYIGYDNKEEVMLKDLRPSNGPESRKIQMEASREMNNDEMECEASNKSPIQTHEVGESKKLEWEPVQPSLNVPKKSYVFNPPHIPPPPPTAWPSSNLSEENSDSLYSMLMSWYMAGYHTGYHQGVTQNNRKKTS